MSKPTHYYHLLYICMYMTDTRAGYQVYYKKWVSLLQEMRKSVTRNDKQYVDN